MPSDARRTPTFRLSDSDGHAHDYAIELFRPHEAAEPMGLLIGAIEGVFAGVSAKGANVDIGSLIGTLRKLPVPAVAKILRLTTRDGKAMSHEASFDVAYTANYGEMYLAVYEVARLNGFFLLPISLPSGSALAQQLSGAAASLAASMQPASAGGPTPSPAA